MCPLADLAPDAPLEEYLQDVKEKRISKPPHCPLCQKGGHLRWHGIYRRIVTTLTTRRALPVRRLLCTLCRRTFSIRPFFITKFRRYANDVIRWALWSLTSQTYEGVAEELLQKIGRCVAIQTLHLWRERFA